MSATRPGVTIEVAPRADRLYLAGFVAANLVLKCALVPLNGGEYTDGIIQLTVFEHGSGLYPPLFGAASKAMSIVGLPLEMAGRVVSAIAGSLVLIPLFLLTRLLFGSDAARVSALLFTVSPLVLRWSIRAMSDSLFLALCFSSLYLIIKGWAVLRDPNSTACSGCQLAMASVLGALAALTRYQGVLLAPLLVGVGLLAWRRGQLPVRTLIGVVPWLGVVWWMVQNSGVHQGQFAGRMGASPFATLAAYWNLTESFILIAPYYLGYPVVALALVGLVRGRATHAGLAPFAVVSLVFGGALLALQATFGAFQYRYMLPLLPMVLVLAGGGAMVLHRLAARRGIHWGYRVGMGLAIVYLALFSMAVLVLQRQAFADQKSAAQFVVENAGQEEPVFSNERYGNFYELGCVKLSFWSGRKVEPLFDGRTGEPVLPPAGAWVLVGSHYGGVEVQEQIIGRLKSQLVLQEIEGGPFYSELLPLMDDIMAQPMLNHNPLGWVMRYSPQVFSTRVLRVAGTR